MWSRKALLRKLFEQMPEAGEEASLEDIHGKNAPVRKNRKCKGPEAGLFLLCLRSSEAVSAYREELVKGRGRKMKSGRCQVYKSWRVS